MKNFLLAFIVFCTLSISAQSLQEYYFNNNFNGTGGGPALSELLSCGAAAGSFGVDSIITVNGLCSVSTAFCFNAGGGVSYPNSAITGTYSINVFFKFNAQRTWARIIDFTNSRSDTGVYYNNNHLHFFPYNFNIGTTTFQPNLYYLLTFVRDGATNVISVYVNGVPSATYTDATGIYKPATTATPINFFRDDNAVPCEVEPGCVKYVSISPNVLSDNEVDSIWQNICLISLPPCTANISYTGSPFSTSVTAAQNVNRTGTTGGKYTSTTGLSIDSLTGAITPSLSNAGPYTVTYTVADTGVCSTVTATTSVTIASPFSVSCDPGGNTLIFTNYDGGYLNINVDVNIPNLKIGVVTYENCSINITGPYAGNVTKVVYAGFEGTNNNCNFPTPIANTEINGVPPANYSINRYPTAGLSNPNGYYLIICAYSCDISGNQGGCNTMDQVLDYFNTTLGGTVYSVSSRYCCWKPSETYSISSLSNSCCLTATPTATINYAGSPYCQSVTAAQPVTVSGSTGGSFSASPAGLIINSVSGDVTPLGSQAGQYTVTYTVAGCPAFTTTTTVEISNTPTATISYSANSYCLGAADQSVTLNGTTGGKYSVDHAGLVIDSLTGTISPANSGAGNYTITYTLPASGACSAFTTTAQVQITNAPSATIAYSNTSFCSNAPVQNVTQGGSNGGKYTVDLNGLLIDSTSGAITPVGSTAGSYVVTYTVAAAGSCAQVTATTSVQIIAAPAATITYSSNAFCPGAAAQNVILTGTPGGTFTTDITGLTIDATTGTITPATSVTGNYIVKYNVAASGVCAAYTSTAPIAISQTINTPIVAGICHGGTYTFGSQTLDTAGNYTHTYTTAAGCDSVVSLTLSFYTSPVASVHANRTTICSGDSVQICATQGFSAYHWRGGDTSTCIYAKSAGNYYVQVTDANHCTAQTSSLSITVYSSPQVSVSLTGDTLAAFNATSYQWYLNGNAIRGAQSSTYIANITGAYQVQITDSNGCTALSNSLPVTVSTGIREILADHFNIYPNPTQNGNVHIDCGPTWIGKTMEVYDNAGQLVYKTEITNSGFDVNLQLPGGVYYIRANSQQNVLVRKLIHL